MKPSTLLAIVAVSFATMAAPVAVQAQSAQTNCQLVTETAERAKKVEKDRLGELEQQTKTKIDTAQLCLEAFAAAAAKLTVLAPGLDLGPIQSIMADAACSVIQKNASSVIPNIPSIPNIQVPNLPNLPTMPTMPPQPSIWDRLTNLILGAN